MLQQPLRTLQAPTAKVAACRALATKSASASKQMTKRAGNIHASLLLQRSPILVKRASKFEQAYFSYRDELARSLASRLPSEIYFKRGSSLQMAWDEIMASKSDDPVRDFINKAKETNLYQETEFLVEENSDASAKEASSAADAKDDDQSLVSRLPTRTLYHLSGTDKGPWFPHQPVKDDKLLHTAAQDLAERHFGPDYFVWVVGRVPVGHLVGEDGSTTFFIRSHYLSGTTNVKGMWLTREEIESVVAPSYYQQIRPMLRE